METVADGPALAVLKDILTRSDELELVGIHSHIGSNIHDADAFIQAAKRMMLLRKTFYATDAYTLPEVDLGGGYSVARCARAGHQLRARTMDRRPGRRDPVSCGHDQAGASVRRQRQDRQSHR